MKAISCGNAPRPRALPTGYFPKQYNTKPENRKNALVLFKETIGFGSNFVCQFLQPSTDPPWFHVCVLSQYHQKKTSKTYKKMRMRSFCLRLGGLGTISFANSLPSLTAYRTTLVPCGFCSKYHKNPSNIFKPIMLVLFKKQMVWVQFRLVALPFAPYRQALISCSFFAQ